jgi:hypothetical protein
MNFSAVPLSSSAGTWLAATLAKGTDMLKFANRRQRRGNGHRFCGFAAVVAAVLGLAWSTPAGAQDARRLCLETSARAEAALGIPAQLLGAIALAETGRWDPQRREIFAWPWTIYADGRARYLPSKRRAIAEVEMLRARGVRNIDVGCMQVNLYHHANAFATLDEAFDPERNVAYAGDFLLRLKEKTRSWSRSIGRYHSATPQHELPYRIKVQQLWNAARRAAALAERDARAAEYRRLRSEIVAKRVASGTTP